MNNVDFSPKKFKKDQHGSLIPIVRGKKSKDGWVIEVESSSRQHPKFYQRSLYSYAGPLKTAKVYFAKAEAKSLAYIGDFGYPERVRKVELDAKENAVKIISGG